MKTRILKTSRQARQRSIASASRMLREGKLVAFPTETVYGLGANIFDAKAVRDLFRVKGRPKDNPLIVHLQSIEHIHELTVSIPVMFWRLADAFIPGPLTVVVKKSAIVPDSITAGLPTVAIRFPDHPVARALLKKAAVPVVAPSANRSGRPSPTLVSHVLEDFDGRIEAILDGGKCKIGLESTVLDLTRRTPIILRPGGVTRERIEDHLRMKVRTARHTEGSPRSPGMKYRHYSPKAQLVVFEGGRKEIHQAIHEMLRVFEGQQKVGVMVSGSSAARFAGAEFCSLGISGAAGAARRLFDGLRELDRKKVRVILCEGCDEKEIGVAVMNRLKKAATQRIKV